MFLKGPGPPGRSKMGPTWPQVGFKKAQDGLKMTHDGPKMAQHGPKIAQDGILKKRRDNNIGLTSPSLFV